jgi:Fe-S cluster assembly scaffold protein SufB
MSAEQTDDSWSAVTSDLRDTLMRSGVNAAVAARLFAAVAPAVAAIERERGGVEHDLLFALIAVQADIFQRRASS